MHVKVFATESMSVCVCVCVCVFVVGRQNKLN